ncbi:hypothetical protein [Methylobacter sp.]|uniref:hypothetical protein n=1 Tax=Methylobacter sp. TaxID=2051955 RepID=UPI002488CF6E|nr:hypothetical protein [Methylobacter sp.]MDI1276603.1 hypothetical protein [Methylobacter sp.]MDI1357290.1 hypothetical protein [Methylobacter sp.]
MIEGLFILTTIFVAYVVYAIIDEQKATAKSKAPVAKPEPQATAVEQPKPQVAVTKEKPAAIKPAEAKTVAPKAAATKAAQPVAAKPVATKATATKTTKAASAKSATAKKPAAVAAKSAGLKDPKTGDVVTAYSNYRFTKRWIKDALVTEGLLEKVYTANELNAEIDAKIKEAIAKLEAMDQYKA